jgi:hypothetical protein
VVKSLTVNSTAEFFKLVCWRSGLCLRWSFTDCLSSSAETIPSPSSSSLSYSSSSAASFVIACRTVFSVMMNSRKRLESARED